jgi:hypothetical protein
MKESSSCKVRRGQVVLPGIIFIILILLALIGLARLLSRTGAPPSIKGEPVKDPDTGLYTVYIIVSGHRDYTFLHMNLHANIHIDFVSHYFSPPPTPPSGHSWTDFSKVVHITVTITSPEQESVLLNTFDVAVSLGARWGRMITYELPAGNYAIEASGSDQDGFASSASATLILP